MKYILKNLDCPNCALKIEEKLQSSGINAKVDFGTLSLITDEKDIGIIQRLVSEVESEVVVLKVKDDNDKSNDFLGGILVSLPFIFTIIYGIFHEAIHHNLLIDFVIIFILLAFGGWRTFLKAYKKIRSREIFDENFLVSLATFSAIALHETFEGLLLITLFNVGEFLENLAVKKARNKIQDTVSENFSKVRLKDSGNSVFVDAKDVKVGDIMLVKPGERILIDGKVVNGSSYIDKSSITGEPIPESVSVGHNVMSGSVNLNGVLEIKATSTFKDTIMYKMLEEIENNSQRTKTEKFISKLSRVYTPSVIVLSVFVAIGMPIILGSYDFREWIYKGLVVVVISCPCAIVISVPLTYFRSLGVLASRNILFKNTSAIDELTEIKTIFFDKTGTLTKGKVRVKSINTVEGISEDEFARYAVSLANYSNHILSKAIVHNFGVKRSFEDIKDVKEIPGYGIIGLVNGKEVLIGSDKLLHEKNILHDACVNNSTVVNVAVDGKYIGYIEFDDDIRFEAKSVFGTLRKLGIEKILILTGDNKENSEKVANVLGVDGLFFGANPQDKVKVVEEYKNNYKEPIAYIGDGINDSIVMLKSDVSFSFNTPVNSMLLASSDVIVNSPDLNRIVDAFVVAKNTRKIVIQNIIIALLVKLLVTVLGVVGLVHLWLAVLADTGVALLTIANSIFRDFLRHRHN
ncbi:MAG: heavy metal translocating P-type ATPase [Brevinematales bacterium]|nr:heavy metal translocating P-type ATPase [Brevinematales bacterium]